MVIVAGQVDSVAISTGSRDDFDFLLKHNNSDADFFIHHHPYAGDLALDLAYRLVMEKHAVLVDVRTAEERKQTGIIPDSVHVAWQTGPAMIKNPRFLKDLAAKVPADRLVLFICRSGRRSIDAAIAATQAGFARSFTVLEGISGLDDPALRAAGRVGWAVRGLPFAKR